MNNQLPSDELLSAYLDGEITPQERELVERALRQDPATRHLLEELRTISGCCRNLSRFALEENFAQQVLQKAERAILLGDGQLDEQPDMPRLRLAGAVDERATPVASSSRRIPASRAAWLRVAAALLVLAPALILMILAARNDERDGRIVSQATPGSARQAPESASTVHYDRALNEELGEKGAEDEYGAGQPEGSVLRRAEDLRALDRAKGAAKSRSAGDLADAPAGAPAPAVTKSEAMFEPANGALFGGAFAMPDDASGTLVVHVAVSEEAWKQGPGQLLAQRKDIKAAELSWRRVTAARETKNGRDGDTLPLALKADGTPAQVGVWDVEASPHEMHALLTNLREQAQTRHNVLALAVQPPAQAKDAGAWAYYNFSAERQEREQAIPPLPKGGQRGSQQAGDQKREKQSMETPGKAATPRAPGGVNMAKQTDDQLESVPGGGKLGAEEMKRARSSGVAPLRREEAAKSQPPRFFKGGVPPQPPAVSATAKGKSAAPADNKAGIGGGGFAPAGKPAKPPLRDGGEGNASAAPKKTVDQPGAESRPATLATAPRSRALFIFYVPTSASPATAAPKPPAPAAEKK